MKVLLFLTLATVYCLAEDWRPIAAAEQYSHQPVEKALGAGRSADDSPVPSANQLGQTEISQPRLNPLPPSHQPDQGLPRGVVFQSLLAGYPQLTQPSLYYQPALQQPTQTLSRGAFESREPMSPSLETAYPRLNQPSVHYERILQQPIQVISYMEYPTGGETEYYIEPVLGNEVNGAVNRHLKSPPSGPVKGNEKLSGPEASWPYGLYQPSVLPLVRLIRTQF